MSRFPLVMWVMALGAVAAWPLDGFGYQCAEIASATGDVGVLRAYIDPGMAGFVIVTVLGLISSIGYMARDYLGRVKRRLFGPGETTSDVGPGDEVRADGDDDREDREDEPC